MYLNKVMLIVVILLLGVGVWFGVKMLNPAVSPETGVMEQKQGDVTAQNSVELKDFSFNPKTLTVKAGSKVAITNKDIAGHSVTADDKSFDSGVLNQGDSTTLTFDSPGTYGYHCTPHPNMTFTVTVE